MGKLAEYLKSEAEAIRSEKQRRRQILEEWLTLLRDLFGRIDAWLAEIDPQGLLDVKTSTVNLNDPALGEYTAPARRVEVGYHSVEIVPSARYIATAIRLPNATKPVRAHGAVEMSGPGHRIYLFQLPPTEWYLQAAAGPIGGAGTHVVPLDAEPFETALAGFLKSRGTADDDA